jgi:hypothetical protein
MEIGELYSCFSKYSSTTFLLESFPVSSIRKNFKIGFGFIGKFLGLSISYRIVCIGGKANVARFLAQKFFANSDFIYQYLYILSYSTVRIRIR